MNVFSWEKKKKVLSTLLTSHIRERRPGRCRDVGRVMKMRWGGERDKRERAEKQV